MGTSAFLCVSSPSSRQRQAAAPKVAGDDELEGGAKNPEQFDEPDEDALDEMAELLGEDEANDD